MTPDFMSPLLLSSDPFALPGDASAHTPNAVQLINPNREAMLIDEFRVTCGTPSPTDWGQVWLKLTYGATPLTNEFIPIKAFMPTYFEYTGSAGGVGIAGVDSCAVWHLARPLYVPPDVQVSGSFVRRLPSGFILGASVDTNWALSIAGRSMPEGMEVPKKIFVPWACATSVFTTVKPPYISGDADIGNPFDTPLNVDYFTGYNVEAGGGLTGLDPTIQMTLSNGKVIARDPIPFTALFPINRPVLRMRALLQPKEFVSVVLDTPIGLAALLNIENTLVFTTVGMTGWRELDTPQGALP